MGQPPLERLETLIERVFDDGKLYISKSQDVYMTYDRVKKALQVYVVGKLELEIDKFGVSAIEEE